MRQKRKELNLEEKVFILKTYYQCNDITAVRDSTMKNFSIKMKNSVGMTIVKLVETFESSGTVNNHYFYDVGDDDQTVLDEKAKEIEVTEEIIVLPVEETDTTTLKVEVQEQIVEESEEFEVYEVINQPRNIDEDDDPSYEPENDDTENSSKKTKANSSRNKRVACRYCQKEFCSRYLYAHYTKVHSDEAKYFCTNCKANFKSFAEFKAHRSEHALSNLECEYCHKTMPNTGTYNRHMKSHLGIRKHVCEVCNKAFQEASTLKLHMRCHTGEKPHSCKTCDKSFTTSASLKVHERVHTGEKPYGCKYCDKSFADSSTRNVHHRQHTGETPYVCNICGKTCKQAQNLRSHMRHMHRKVST